MGKPHRWRAALVASIAAIGLAGCELDRTEGAGGSLGETGLDLAEGRYGHTQTLLPDGSVLVVGGIRRTDRGRFVRNPDTAERFDPLTESFEVVAASPLLRRSFHAAVYCDAGTPTTTDDFILLAGGIEAFFSSSDPFLGALASVVRVDVGDGSFAVTEVGDLPGPAMDITGHALPDGRAVFVGGRDADGLATAAVQIWPPDADPAGVEEVALNTARFNHRSTFVPNTGAGWVLVTGGRSSNAMIVQREAIDLDDLSVHPVSGGRAVQYHALVTLDNDTASTTDDAILEIGGLSIREESVNFFQDGHLDDVVTFRLIDQGVGNAPGLQVLGSTGFLQERVVFHAAIAATGQTAIVSGGFTSLFVNDRGFYTGSFIDSNPIDEVAALHYDAIAETVTFERLPRLARDRAMHAMSRFTGGAVFTTGGINDDRNSVRGAEGIAP